MPTGKGLLLMDACVVIDLCNADISLLSLISAKIGRIHVPTPVMVEEVEPVRREDWASRQVDLVEPSLSVAAEAAQRRTGLSFHDRLCLLMARDNGWTCVTNDARLRKACAAEGVPVLWGLELVALVVEAGALTASAATEIAAAIRAANPAFITEEIFDQFRRRLQTGASKSSKE